MQAHICLGSFDRSCSVHVLQKTLQAVNCDLGKAFKDVHVSTEAIANARNETTWNKGCGRIESIAEAVDITITNPRTVSIQRHRSNACNDQRQSPKDYFLVNVYYQFTRERKKH